jgi:hypothetical protein
MADVDRIADEKFLYFLEFCERTNKFSVVFIKIIREGVCNFSGNCTISISSSLV